MLGLSEAESSQLDKEHRQWVFSIPTQAHVKAVSPGEAPALALSDAVAIPGGPTPELAKLKGDLLRVEGTLPRSALQESWQADSWRQVSAPVLLHADLQKMRPHVLCYTGFFRLCLAFAAAIYPWYTGICLDIVFQSGL